MELFYVLISLLGEYWINLLLFILTLSFICSLVLLHIDEKYNNNLS